MSNRDGVQDEFAIFYLFFCPFCGLMWYVVQLACTRVSCTSTRSNLSLGRAHLSS
jgi:hypothetical protein